MKNLIICNCATGLGTAFQRNGILKQLVINMYKIVFEKYKVPLLDEAYNIAIEAHKFFIMLERLAGMWQLQKKVPYLLREMIILK